MFATFPSRRTTPIQNWVYAMQASGLMAIAVDQSKLRIIVQSILAGERLSRSEAEMILEIAQLAAGADDAEQPMEHAVLQSIAQHVSSLVGLRSDEISAIPPLSSYEARMSWFRALSSQLTTRAAHELAFAMAFLVSVADLELQDSERERLEELQHALGVDDRRATDIVVRLTETVASTQ
jgi:tellurite resistance protein